MSAEANKAHHPSDDRGDVQWHEGELWGVPPTGKRFSVGYVHWHHLGDGKLVERWGVRMTGDAATTRSYAHTVIIGGS